MKPICRRFAALTLALFGVLGHVYAQTSAASASGLWSPLGLRGISNPPPFKLAPDKYAHFQLAESSMQTLLNQASQKVPLTTTKAAGILLIPVPLPSGEMVNLMVEETDLMAAGLAAKFPSIKTYRVSDANGQAITGRADFTEQGFHAMFNTEQGTVFVDPRTDVSGQRTYVSYYKSDYQPDDKDPREMICLAGGGNQPVIGSTLSPALRLAIGLAARSGSQLSTYRLAVAATGEYTAYQGGTVSAALSAIATTINRVNFIYERDAAIHLQLVANNNAIIYTNGTTDPYTNIDGYAMLSENQSNLDAVIGSANYDVGHVFSTGGGGVASLESPCSTSRKAQGVTGSSQPVGDPFDIDYVAHEMGHQFGGNHTFNGTSGSCGGGNRVASRAYEPGSGTTIMAYAGICNPQDLQPNSDSLFHAGSIAEIITFVTSGAQQTCGTRTAINNVAPVANAGSNYTIPANTPFVLTGSATDANVGDSLTYAWDEMDTGTASSSVATMVDDGSRTLFRSFVPSSSPVRYFPKLQSILTNTSDIGERLPTTNRSLNFRLTVRDQHGGVADDDTLLSVTTSSGPFRLTAPNGSETFTSSANVTWNVANTTAAPVSCANVDISLSTDGGLTYPVNLLTGTPNDGLATVVFPSGSSGTARIKIQCSNNIFLDISDNDFSFNNTLTVPGVPTNITATAYPGRIQVSFSAPANNGGSSITAYSVTCSAAGQTTRTKTGAISPISVYGLTAGVAYACSVTAANSMGSSSASATATATAKAKSDLTPILMLLLD